MSNRAVYDAVPERMMAMQYAVWEVLGKRIVQYIIIQDRKAREMELNACLRRTRQGLRKSATGLSKNATGPSKSATIGSSHFLTPLYHR